MHELGFGGDAGKDAGQGLDAIDEMPVVCITPAHMCSAAVTTQHPQPQVILIET